MNKNGFIFLVVLILLFSSINKSQADTGTKKDEIPQTTRFTYISSVNTSFSISPIGMASCYASINAYSGVDNVRISAYLQKDDNGWGTVKHWTEDYSGTYGAMAKNWYVAKGYLYRWMVYFYAYDGDESESIYITDYYDFY